MPSFGNISTLRLSTCDKKLQDILTEAIKIIDFSIICGHRNEIEQQKMFAEGKSKLQYPKSKHNSMPSKAVDIAPYRNGIDWNNIGEFKKLAGLIFGIAHSKGIKLRWGGTWGGLDDLNQSKFLDFPHFELV